MHFTSQDREEATTNNTHDDLFGTHAVPVLEVESIPEPRTQNPNTNSISNPHNPPSSHQAFYVLVALGWLLFFIWGAAPVALSRGKWKLFQDTRQTRTDTVDSTEWQATNHTDIGTDTHAHR